MGVPLSVSCHAKSYVRLLRRTVLCRTVLRRIVLRRTVLRRTVLRWSVLRSTVLRRTAVSVIVDSLTMYRLRCMTILLSRSVLTVYMQCTALTSMYCSLVTLFWKTMTLFLHFKVVLLPGLLYPGKCSAQSIIIILWMLLSA